MDEVNNNLTTKKLSLSSPRWWRYLNRDTLRADLSAGLTGAVIVLPQSIALALLAGLPVEYGFYTAIIPVIVAALFGSSLHLISGPTTAISIVIFATISPLAAPGSEHYITLVLTVTFLAGMTQVALGAARLGELVNFISHSVKVGFTAGAAILILTSQLKHIFGISLPTNQPFLYTWTSWLQQLPEWKPSTIIIAAVTLATAIIIYRFVPKWPRFLIAIAAGALCMFVLGREGIPTVGAVPSSLPPLTSPDLSLDTWRQLMSAALAISILGLVEAVAISRSIANSSHQYHDPNREFIGQGLSNIAGSFFSSYASSGSFTRSVLNHESGARTPMAAIFSAIGIALIMLLLAPLVSHLPIAAMAAVLIYIAYQLVDFHSIKVIFKASRSDTAVLFTTFLSTLFVDLTFAIYSGVLLSLVLHLIRISHPGIIARVPDPEDANRRFIAGTGRTECPQLKIIRIDGSLFFGAVHDVEEALHAIDFYNPEQTRVLIICSGINFIDIAGAELLKRETLRRRELGGDLYLCSVKSRVLTLLREGGYLDVIGNDHIFAAKATAIKTIFSQLDPQRCQRCNARVFGECPPPPPANNEPNNPAYLEPDNIRSTR